MEKISRALEAAHALLADRAWHPWTELVDAMVITSDVLPKTASNHRQVRLP